MSSIPEEPIETTPADDSLSVIHPKTQPKGSVWVGVVLFVVLGCSILWYGIVYAHWDSGIARTFTKIVPVPAVVLNGSNIRYSYLLDQVDLVRTVGENIGAEEHQLTKSFLFPKTLDALVHQRAVEQLADEAGVSVTQKEVKERQPILAGGMTDEEFEAHTQATLGLSGKEALDVLVRPMLLAQRLEEHVLQSATHQVSVHEVAMEAKRRLDAGEDFALVAGELSEDPSGVRGGDKGYFTRETAPDGWEVIFDLPEGGYSDMVETESEFVILGVSEIIGSGDLAQVRTQAIVFNKLGLDEVIDAYLEESNLLYIIHLEEDVSE